MTEWVVIKGICDFAAAKTKTHQETAASNAFEFVSNIIRDGGLNTTALLKL
jgi:hypothetical protein